VTYGSESVTSTVTNFGKSVTSDKRDSSRARYGKCHGVTHQKRDTNRDTDRDIVGDGNSGVTCRFAGGDRHITPCWALDLEALMVMLAGGAQRWATASA
jgi:hypothetical protein